MKTIVLFLDAFRFDDLTRENCPYIYNLAETGISSRIKTLAGYHVEYSMLSGYYPLKHNVWTWYYYDTKNSCFKWIKPLKPLFKLLDRTFLRSPIRAFISYSTMFFRYINGKTRFLKVNEIPIDKIENFNISVDKFYTDKNSLNVPTLFDTLRNNGKNYFALEYPWVATNRGMKLAFFKSHDKSNFKLLKKMLKEDYDIFYCHIWNLDSLQHKYGIKSKEALSHMKDIDDNVRGLVDHAKNIDDVNVVIFSDHGMTPVKETINALEVIKDYDAEYFLGSTMVQLWLNDKSKSNEIRQRFLKLNCLVYDEKNISELHIPFNRPYTGDMLIAAKPGCQFYPDFFRKDKNAMAMHGYVTKNEDLDGIFIVNGNGAKRVIIKDSSLVDIVPTILKIINIKTKERYDGKALI